MPLLPTKAELGDLPTASLGEKQTPGAKSGVEVKSEDLARPLALQFWARKEDDDASSDAYHRSDDSDYHWSARGT
jgi:hypothetical protein